jgi:hypothetical protein
MDAADNLKLVEYYRSRRAWPVMPDAQSLGVSSCPAPEQDPSVPSQSIADRAAQANLAIGSKKHD